MTESKSLKQLGRNIKLIRIHAGLTQVELGNRLGADDSHVCKLESGTRNLSILTLIKIAKALNVALVYLLEDIT
jgi:transcriptional regulator with XRE-family HTH domain